MAARPKQARLRPRALADLENIWRYTTEQWSEEQAEIYHNKIVDSMAALATGRLRGRSAEDVRPGYLKYRIGSHFIFYRTAGYGIDVIRILHQQMDVDRHL
jgi:toxin ParE1/3/4